MFLRYSYLSHQLTAHWLVAFILSGIRIGSCDWLKGFAEIFGLYDPYLGICLYDVIRRIVGGGTAKDMYKGVNI